MKGRMDGRKGMEGGYHATSDHNWTDQNGATARMWFLSPSIHGDPHSPPCPTLPACVHMYVHMCVNMCGCVCVNMCACEQVHVHVTNICTLPSCM